MADDRSSEDGLVVLRLYFSGTRMRATDRWWRKLAPQRLGPHLLLRAQKHGVEQALLHRVIGGFLRNDRLVFDGGEMAPVGLPQCLELIGTEDVLRSYLRENQQDLTRVRAVFLHGKEARQDVEAELRELEQTLHSPKGEGR